jgi:hypothetical protein
VRFELQTLESYSDEGLLAELVRVAAALRGERLTIKRFDALSKVHSTTIRTRFGSWSAALDRAGISETVAPRPRTVSRDDVLAAIRAHARENAGASASRDQIAARLAIDRGTISRKFGSWEALLLEVGLSPVPLGRRYSEDECFENLLNLWTHYGRQPRFAELNRSPSTVGSKAYVRRWGGWRGALAAFVQAANQAESSPNSKADPERSDAPEPPSAAVPQARAMSLALRYRILSRDRFRCVACGRSPAKDGNVELHVDHIIPWSRGGGNVEPNLRTLCAQCNLGKGAKIDEA